MDGVDLSNLQQIDFGGDTGFYDPSSGKYYDSGGNALSSAELAQYGSFTVTGLGSAAPSQPSPSGAVTGSGSGAALAGLSGLFSTIGNAIVNATRSPTVRTPTGGTLVYNPSNGWIYHHRRDQFSSDDQPAFAVAARGRRGLVCDA
jgi:hypothetical protein